MSERTWGGSTLADRRAGRRANLLAVAQRIAGEEGSA
ncbi:TetR/AcrR family transcriptional regulator, partial [Streptomyces sp. T-3]|nr:TetR/AcrR family transcriptional regulator [Streptomyces sp. T-3]